MNPHLETMTLHQVEMLNEYLRLTTQKQEGSAHTE